MTHPLSGIHAHVDGPSGLTVVDIGEIAAVSIGDPHTEQHDTGMLQVILRSGYWFRVFESAENRAQLAQFLTGLRA